MVNYGNQTHKCGMFFIVKESILLWNQSNLDSVLDVTLKNMWFEGNEWDILSISFFHYKMGIPVLVTLNIKCDTLNYESVIGIYG